jgi:hypothetical protein
MATKKKQKMIAARMNVDSRVAVVVRLPTHVVAYCSQVADLANVKVDDVYSVIVAAEVLRLSSGKTDAK